MTTFGFSTLSNNDPRGGRHRKRRSHSAANPIDLSRSNSGDSWATYSRKLSGSSGRSRNNDQLFPDSNSGSWIFSRSGEGCSANAGGGGGVTLCRFSRQGSAASLTFRRESTSPPNTGS